MAALDEDALICDFAETYHLRFDELPKDYAAVLAAGLPYTSRIMNAIKRREEEIQEELKARAKRNVGNSNEKVFESPEEFKEALEAARRA